MDTKDIKDPSGRPAMQTADEKMEARLEERRQNRRSGLSGTQIIMRTIFGILMIVVYVGMGVLLLINFFDWTPGWAIPRYVVGIMLIIYGIYRAWRQYKGIDSPI